MTTLSREEVKADVAEARAAWGEGIKYRDVRRREFLWQEGRMVVDDRDAGTVYVSYYFKNRRPLSGSWMTPCDRDMFLSRVRMTQKDRILEDQALWLETIKWQKRLDKNKT